MRCLARPRGFKFRTTVVGGSGKWKRKLKLEAERCRPHWPRARALSGSTRLRAWTGKKELPGSVDELYKSACGATRDPEQRKRARVVRWGPRAAINRGVGSWACVAGTRRVINRAGVGLFCAGGSPETTCWCASEELGVCRELEAQQVEAGQEESERRNGQQDGSKSKKFGPWPQARQRKPEKLEIAGSCTKREPKKEPGGCGQCCDFLSWTCSTVKCGGQDGGGTHSSVQVISFPADRSRPLL